jgi:hypothetical protein
VSFLAGNRIERFDPDGSKRPQRGVEIRGEAGVAEQDAGNGPTASISPKPGLTGESEVAVSRTALLTVQQGIEAVGGNFDPRMAVRKRAVVLGERKAVARCRFQPDRCQAAFRGTDPLPPKAVTGSLRSHRRSFRLLKLRAVHAGVGLDCESDHLEPFFGLHVSLTTKERSK